MGKVKYHVVVDQLTGALDSKKYGESHGMRMVSRYRKGSGDEHQIYFLRKHEGAWSEGATKNRELIKAAQKRAHAIEKAARKPEECSAEAVAEAAEWQARFQAYRAGLQEGEKGYGSLYTYTYVQIYKELKIKNYELMTAEPCPDKIRTRGRKAEETPPGLPSREEKRRKAKGGRKETNKERAYVCTRVL